MRFFDKMKGIAQETRKRNKMEEEDKENLEREALGEESEPRQGGITAEEVLLGRKEEGQKRERGWSRSPRFLGLAIVLLVLLVCFGMVVYLAGCGGSGGGGDLVGSSPDQPGPMSQAELEQFWIDTYNAALPLDPHGTASLLDTDWTASVPAACSTASMGSPVFPSVKELLAKAEPLRWTFEDVDSDGDEHLLFHFETQELQLDENSTYATLTAQTVEGKEVTGTDMVKIVPKSK